MRLSRSKNAVRNASYGLINKIINIILPFAVRTVFIKTLGSEFLGMNSLFTSILTVLNLTELGFSSAVVFCMYKPIAEDDTRTINALLAFYKTVYRIIGLLILGIGVLLIPFLPYLINGSYPSTINLNVVYLFFLINTALSYFLFAYLQALISAFQREDLISRINIFIAIVMNAIQIVTLLVVNNYYAYLLIMPIFTVINNLRTAYIAHRYFPEFKPFGKLSDSMKSEIKEKIGGLVIGKVCKVSRNAFDSIFISMFLGLTETAIYNNYYYIMSSIVAIMTVLTNAITAGVGNSVAMDTVQKNYEDMNKMNFIYMWLAGWFTICLLCLYQPFMKIWVGESLMFSMKTVCLICLYFYCLKMGDIRTVYVTSTGIWWQNRYRAIFEACTNLVLNYFLGKYFGVVGIISATIISLFIVNFLYGSSIIFKYYFKNQNISEYFFSNTIYAITTLFAAFITYLICIQININMYVDFLVRAIVCMLAPNIVYFSCYCKTAIFRNAVPWLFQKIGLKRNRFFFLINK